MTTPDDDKIDSSFLDSLKEYVTFENVLNTGLIVFSIFPVVRGVTKGYEAVTVVYKGIKWLIPNGIRYAKNIATSQVTKKAVKALPAPTPFTNLPVLYDGLHRLKPIVLANGTEIFKNTSVHLLRASASKIARTGAFGLGAYQLYDSFSAPKGAEEKEAFGEKEKKLKEKQEDNTSEQRLKSIKDTTWEVNPKKKKTKVIRPLMGVVTPLVKILHVNPSNKELTDLTVYLRVISISWVDRNEKYLDSFIITCAYHPDLTKLDTSFVVYPVIGTHLKENLPLGLFYLARIKKEMQSGTPTVTLIFSSYKFDVPASRELVNPKVCVKKSYYEVIADHAKKLGYKFVYDDHEELFSPYSMPGEKPMTWLEIIESIAHYLDMEFKIKKKTFYLKKRSSNKDRVQYYIHLANATSFTYAKDLSNSYDSAEVISSVLTPDKKTIRGVAGKKDSSGNPAGKVVTKYVDYSYKEKEQATKDATILLNRVNSSITSCTLTVPNCILFAGHNIIVDQSTADFSEEEPPLNLRIREVKHEISPAGWFATLTLDDIKVDSFTQNLEKAKDIRTQTKAINSHITKLLECTANQDLIDDFLKVFETKYELVATQSMLANKGDFSKFALLDLLQDRVLDMEAIFTLPPPLKNHQLILCIITFIQNANKIDKELAQYDANLEAINKPTERYVKTVFDRISTRAVEKWELK